MKALFLGATGLIGSQILKYIQKQEKFENIFCFTRQKIPSNSKTFFITYNSSNTDLELKITEVVNQNQKDKWIIYLFTGETIFGLINDKKWENIYKSRVLINQKIVSVLEKLGANIEKIFSASAIGIYYNSKTQEVDENSEIQPNILTNLITEWENTVLQSPFKEKSIILRIGAVLDKKSKVYQSLILPSLFSIGINFKPTSFFPWIYNEEIPLILDYLLNQDFNGIVNTVANNTTYKEFLEIFIQKKSILKKAFIIDIDKKFLEKILKILMPKYYEITYSLFSSPKINSIYLKNYNFKFSNIEEVIEKYL